MHIFARGEYQIVSFSPAAVRVCTFRKRGQKYRVVKWNCVENTTGNLAETLRKAVDANGGQISGCFILTGAFETGTFFRCEGSSVSLKELRNSMEFELPFHMLKVPDEPFIQFEREKKKIVVEKNEEGEDVEIPQPDFLNVYAFDSNEIHSLGEFLSSAKCKADDCIYPLLGVSKWDPAVYLPEIEPGFCWRNGEWSPYSGNIKKCNDAWLPIVQDLIEIPVGFQWQEYMACILVLRNLADKALVSNESAMRIVPVKWRPSRCRIQVYIMITILLIFLAGWLYRSVNIYYERYQAYRVLVEEQISLKSKIDKVSKNLKKAEKEEKDLEKLLLVKSGDTNFLRKLYDLSVCLPESATVSNFRFTDGGANLTVSSDNQTSNIQNSLRRMTTWKISQIQQRTISGTSVMSTLRLAPKEEE